MKRLPMTWGRWAELVFGSILPTIAMVLFLMMGALITLGSPPYNRSDHDYFYRFTIILWQSVVSMMPIVSSWLLTLFGPKQIIQRPLLHRLVVAVDILGLLVISYILFNLFWVRNYSFSLYLVLISPVMVGLRYLPRLLRK